MYAYKFCPEDNCPIPPAIAGFPNAWEVDFGSLVFWQTNVEFYSLALLFYLVRSVHLLIVD